jgi:hypothetical protein
MELWQRLEVAHCGNELRLRLSPQFAKCVLGCDLIANEPQEIAAGSAHLLTVVVGCYEVPFEGTDVAGDEADPHVTIGVRMETYLNEMLAEPFQSFTFSATGASVYQLGSFGTARKELKALPLTP